MLLGKAEENSPYLCHNCNGATRWVLPLNLRNAVVALSHLSYFIGCILFMIFYAKSGASDLITMVVWALGLWFIRKLYKTRLVCVHCGIAAR